MKILADLGAEVPGTNGPSFGLLDYSNPEDKDILFWGYNSPITNYHNTVDIPEDTKRKSILNIWMPTEFAQEKDHYGINPIQYNVLGSEVYGICPYTVEWLKGIVPQTKFKYIFYPFNKKDIPEKQEKLYDVCYFGSIHGREHAECLDVISNFNYRYMSMSHHINTVTANALSKYGTDVDLTHKEKIKKVGQCKISVCYHIVHTSDKHQKIIKSQPHYSKNKAFSKLTAKGIFPQFKSRMHEAAIARTLNLVCRDDWNLVEDYYTPGEDFIYFNNNSELLGGIEHILNNWDKAERIIENAYNKAMTYEVGNMMKIIENGDQWKSNVVDRVTAQA